MNITKAMKKISRLKGEIAETKDLIKSNISVMEPNEFAFNFGELYKKLTEQTHALIELKVKIMEANIKNGVFEKILNLGELKAMKAFVGELPIQEGFQDRSFFGRSDETPKKYKTQLTNVERKAIVDALKATIETTLDELDEFNATTII